MGTTSTFLKSRVSKPTVGKWSSGFSVVKKYADDNKIPLIAVWSNGDACGHCIMFEKSCMQSAFTKWMKTSGCVFWFGCSSDTSKDDKLNGTGYTWAWKNQSLKMYPFVRVWWKAGKVDKADIGDYWDGGSGSGGATFVKKLQSLLKNFKPGAQDTTPTPEPAPEPAPSTNDDCNGGNCDPGACDGDCSTLKAEVESLRSELKSFEASFTSKLDAIEAKLSK